MSWHVLTSQRHGLFHVFACFFLAFGVWFFTFPARAKLPWTFPILRSQSRVSGGGGQSTSFSLSRGPTDRSSTFAQNLCQFWLTDCYIQKYQCIKAIERAISTGESGWCGFLSQSPRLSTSIDLLIGQLQHSLGTKRWSIPSSQPGKLLPGCC